MPRAAYQAPGVYVEEIPSAQQPIAGVGTNTVGFIGMVPAEIQYPVPNPDYDPVDADLALQIAGGKSLTTEEDIAGLDERIRTHSSAITRLQEVVAGKQREWDEAKRLLDSVENEIKTVEQKAEAERTEEELNELDAKRREQGRLRGQIARLDGEISASKEESDNRERERKELQDLKEGRILPLKLNAVSVLHPYILREFKVTVDPGDTKLCTNFTEYTDRFGSFSADDPKYAWHRALTHAVNGFFKNGGTRCFVARIEREDQLESALEAFESIDEVSLIAAPGLSGQGVWDALVAHCGKCEDRFAILDSCEVIGVQEEKEAERTERKEPELDLSLLNYDSPQYQEFLPARNKNAAFYIPWIEVIDPAKQLQDVDRARNVEPKYRGRLFVPPSGHIAGVYARTDEERGVHKAPANTAILGALNVKYYVGKSKQAGLNPQGVNCIRNINGNITVWGARTIGGDRNGEWKYVNVRRLFLFLRESIDEGTQWVVFEPNDPALWGKIRRNLTAFLTNVWRSGALFGLSPEEAFYVKCDAELNPPEVRDLGQVITEIGVAIVRPAEFVIFRVTQDTGARRS